MSGFFDTNVLLYAQEAGRKGDLARVALSAGGKISAQVLNEFTSVSRRKQRKDWPEIAEAIADALTVVDSPLPLTIELHAAALALARDHGFSFYDALIVAAAIEAGCDILYSEDLQHGRAIGGLTIHNPFLDAAQ